MFSDLKTGQIKDLAIPPTWAVHDRRPGRGTCRMLDFIGHCRGVHCL